VLGKLTFRVEARFWDDVVARGQEVGFKLSLKQQSPAKVPRLLGNFNHTLYIPLIWGRQVWFAHPTDNLWLVWLDGWLVESGGALLSY